MNKFLTIIALGFSTTIFAQQTYEVKGRVIDVETQKTVDYAAVSIYSNSDAKNFASDVTSNGGQFSFQMKADHYFLAIDALGYEAYEYDVEVVDGVVDLGTIALKSSAELLEDIVLEAKRPDVEFKLDKKVYNISENNIVRGGTASGVLENIPSVEVDADGNVSLRGNGAVRVFIDGKNTGLSSNIADALKMIPAESIDQVEVITNPSARYSAEGSAGILNIKLKKGTNKGTNGSVSLAATQFGGYNVNLAANHKMNKTNYFVQIGYQNDISQGDYKNYADYLDANGQLENSVNEYYDREQVRKGLSGRAGVDWQMFSELNWTQSVSFRSLKQNNPVDLFYDFYDADGNLVYTRNRATEENGSKNQVGYNTEWKYVFDEKEGHELVVIGAITKDVDDRFAEINTLYNNQLVDSDRTYNDQKEWERQVRADYVLPLPNDKRFEVGYQGDFNINNNIFEVKGLQGNEYVTRPLFLSNLRYEEQINAFYSQFAGKKGAFNYMFGLRWELSRILIDQYVLNESVEKKYNNFFPSAFLNYELGATSNISLNYTRRIWRPRGRMINPVSSYSSSINFFSGDPNLDPSFTDVMEFSYLKRMKFATLQAQLYYNYTQNSIEYVRRTFGVNNEGIPITIIGLVNLSTQYKIGTDINLSMKPYGWWRLNAGINMYKAMNRGDFSYTNENNERISQNFDSDAFSYMLRVNNNINLPWEVQWQSSMFYRAGERNAQGRSRAMYDISTSLSRDFWDENATLSLGVTNLLNSRKMIREVELPNMNSRVEMQWRKRMITLSFSYRFNQSKREAKRNEMRDSDGGDMMM